MFCFKKEIRPLLVTVWDMLWRMKDLWQSWWEVPNPHWRNEGLTWHSLWAFKDKHNPLPQKWYKSVSFPVLRVYSSMVWRFLDIHTTVYAIQNRDQYDAFFCIYQYMYHFACLPRAFYFVFLVLRLVYVVHSQWPSTRPWINDPTLQVLELQTWATKHGCLLHFKTWSV